MSSVLFLASARSDGHTRKICTHISDISAIPCLDFNDFNISYYDYHQGNEKDDFIKVIEQILAYDTIIFATPVYWYSMSAQMKTFLDRFTDLLKIRKDLGRQLKAKSMKVICCSSDATEYPEFWMPFKRSADYLGMLYKGHAHTWIEKDDIPAGVKNRLIDLIK